MGRLIANISLPTRHRPGPLRSTNSPSPQTPQSAPWPSPPAAMAWVKINPDFSSYGANRTRHNSRVRAGPAGTNSNAMLFFPSSLANTRYRFAASSRTKKLIPRQESHPRPSIPAALAISVGARDAVVVHPVVSIPNLRQPRSRLNGCRSHSIQYRLRQQVISRQESRHFFRCHSPTQLYWPANQRYAQATTATAKITRLANRPNTLTGIPEEVLIGLRV
jgi:hypothetical protein